ncbi:MAG: hypothetical protein ABSG78_18165 [Verrucomicrobiota bacterium]|jgi:hypothetical protein
MKSCLRSFNIYLLAAAALAGGCSSNHFSMRKEYSTLRVYLEGPPGESSLVYVTRAKTPMYVGAEPFLTEEDVSKARLVDNPDGTFDIQVTFNDHGGLVLDMTTTSNRGRHLVIFSHFPPKGWKQPQESGADSVEKPEPGKPRVAGWLAAPLIRTGLSNGSLKFTPDASHDEAERIVRGLNNMVSDLDK